MCHKILLTVEKKQFFCKPFQFPVFLVKCFICIQRFWADLNTVFFYQQVRGEISPENFTIYENEKASIQFKMHMLEHRQELLQFEGPAKLKRLNDWILRDPRFESWLSGLDLETRENVIEDELMTVKKRDHHWTPAQRKKVWKLESEDGEIIVGPLDKENLTKLSSNHARGDGAAGSQHAQGAHAGTHKRAKKWSLFSPILVFYLFSLSLCYHVSLRRVDDLYQHYI